MKNLVILLVFFFSVGLCTAQENKGVKFLDISFEQAFEQAKQEGKQVFVKYSTKGCAPCKIMDMSVYTDASIAKKMNQNFVCIKLDPMKDKSLTKRARDVHKIKGFPTMMFFKSNVNLISKEIGGKSVEEFKQLLNDVVAGI